MTEKNQLQKPEDLIASLTRREQEVLRLLVLGMKNPEIAATLAIKARTVRSHLENISQKLGVQGRERLIVWMWKNGLGEE